MDISKLTGTFVGGVVHDVVPRKFGEADAAEIQIKTTVQDKKGRPVDSYIDVRVSPDQVKSGWDNAYRQKKGQFVVAPLAIGQYKGQNETFLQYSCAGMPISLAVPAAVPKAG